MTPGASTFPPGLLADIQRDWAIQDYGRALERVERHWRAAPKDPWLSLHYARILGHCSHFTAAQSLLEGLVCDAAPDGRLWALGSAGVASADFKRFDWAADYMRRAAAEHHPPAEVFYRWAEALERLNRLPEAAVALANGRARFADHPGLMLLAARVARRSGAIEEAERLARSVLVASHVTPEIQCQAGYELGHTLDAQDRCAEAYAAFVAAKEIQRPHAKTFESMWRSRICRMQSPENLPRAKHFRRWAQEPPAAPRPHAFLVGCPRSGTTLLERMLGSHPQVASSSESTVWHSAVWMPLLRDCDAKGITGMRSVLSALTSQQLEASRNRYWQDIVQTVGGEARDRLLLDKNPSIFSMLPGAVRFFPDARMLVALRDPRDIVWSCFTQHLPVNAATAAYVELESTAEQVATELEQWLQLRQRIATPWLEIRYETIVRRTEVELQRVLTFLGLPWSPEMLTFYLRRDMVRSPTYAAAAQPVHQEGVGRWRRYAALVEPLEARLSEVIRELE